MFLISFSIIFPTVSLIWVFIHELGHAIAALLVGFKISSFKFGPCVLYLKNEKFKFGIDFKTLKNYLGRVHPIVYGITTDKQYNSLTFRVLIIYLGGPIFELAGLCLYFYTKDYIPNEIVRISISITIITLFGMSFLLGSDIPGAVKIFSEKVMEEISIYAWSMYGNRIDVTSNRFIVEKLLKKADEINPSHIKINRPNYQDFYYIMLELYLAGYIHKLPDDFMSVLEDLTAKLCASPTKKVNQHYLILVYRYLTYLIFKGENPRIIEQRFFQLEKYDLSNNKDVLYERKRTQHFLGLKDNLDFLLCRDNLSSFFAHDEGFYNINKKINENRLEKMG